MTIEQLIALCGTAAFLGSVHTIAGPDHYVPFIAMSQARGWSGMRTAVITLLCGVGHVLSSVLIGLIGIGIGVALGEIEAIENARGDWAAWLLTAFGVVYLVWGVRRAIRNKPHTHLHIHGVKPHAHEHNHHGDHVHVHEAGSKKPVTPWVLFVIFVFGPCEVLIPTLMYPAYKGSVWGAALVVIVFTIATLTTMTMAVLVGRRALKYVPGGKLERYSHALAGLALVVCGVSMQVGL